jgi:hypothetical protein
MATRSPTTDILMIKDVAENVQVTEGSPYRLAAAKSIPAIKVGEGWMLSWPHIYAWVMSQMSVTPLGKD